MTELKNIEPDYVHSSNALFSFMKEASYLEDALLNKRLCPRYCGEKIEYLNLYYNGKLLKEVDILQKCFCDIPLHNIAKRFSLKEINEKADLKCDVKSINAEENTHTDFYGSYGISFSKNWAQEKNLQPVQYINPKSTFANQFKKTFEYVSRLENVDDLIVSDIISRLSYFKPLHGKMSRIYNNRKLCLIKNFHDECEWRYVPSEELLEKYHVSSAILDEETRAMSSQISEMLSREEYNELWLKFDYQDVRYLIVPDNEARNRIIDFIMKLELDVEEEKKDKLLLVSKVLVLEDIKKDY